METRTDLVTELLGTVGRFRRTVRRTAPGSFATSGLPESQAELLRLVGRQPGISVSAAAAELGLAANTASTLVSKLATEGLLVRTADPDDRRVGRLELTPPAQQLADESRAVRRAALAEALEDLDADDTEALIAGIRVLADVTATLRKERP
ncbi:MarR family winged helix-turn-helix transcriptional regulator [Mycolicibacterium sphagni]|uniref:MarR family winged helix-turn-helix transcriptional regulator n=1 Tax=Mycolicibacterium sphagni TaxID=1786 RepID=UPI0021F3013F|nr:MarR family transcriptional regulator [Mycolicibacterium sphagni]MCV7174380.1 MarR family transcriptional regulator [Mycolicibacterium sphagni]